jgi:beta-lactamase class D
LVKRWLVLLVASLVVLSLSACGASPGKVTQIDLQKQFGSFQGTFKLYDLTNHTYKVYHPDPAGQRYSPASTFKVLHSLIALQTGVVPDEKTVMKWDGTVYSTAEWNRDQTLTSAVQNSTIWYFQAVARQVGRDREQQYLDKVGFGNRQIGSAIDAFWLDGSLLVSVDEQLDFMTRLYKEELPFDARAMQTVKRILVREQTSSYTLAGKTGSAVRVTPNVGWYVGYVVSDGKPYTFVTRIEGGAEASGAKAREITDAVLGELGLVSR